MGKVGSRQDAGAEVSFATRVGDLGCGVGYTNKPFQIHEILWGAEVRRPCRVMFLIYTEVQVPLLQGTMEYDGASVLSLVLLGEPYGTPIRRPRCCCRSCAGCTAPHPPTPPLYGLRPDMSESSGTPGENLARGSFASVFP